MESKRVQSDIQRVVDTRDREVMGANERMEDLNIELRQIEQQKIAFRQEMQQTEVELRQKLATVEESSRELAVKEEALAQQTREFQEFQKQQNQEMDSLPRAN